MPRGFGSVSKIARVYYCGTFEVVKLMSLQVMKIGSLPETSRADKLSFADRSMTPEVVKRLFPLQQFNVDFYFQDENLGISTPLNY
jgi:hypothetical protein